LTNPDLLAEDASESAATNNGSRLRTRLKAAAVHLLISAFIICTTLIVMIKLWYPGPLFYSAGGDRLVTILACVDIVIGPLITLIIFDRRKKDLVYDLAIIGILQCGALIYGAHTIFAARPAFIVFAKDRFELVRAPEISPADLARATEGYRTLPLWGPRWVGTRFPTDPDKQVHLIEQALQGKDIQNIPEYYVPLEENAVDLRAKALPVERLLQRDPVSKATTRDALQRLQMRDEDVGFLPLMGRQESLAALVRRSDGTVVDVIRVDPW
jgi:hypothetical protein